MQARGLRDIFRWPLRLDAVWLSSPLFVATLASLLAPIRPFDYFWALAQGRASVQLGRITTENAFLFTLPADAPFVNQPWLAELLMFGAYALGGHSANLALLALLHAFALFWLMDGALRAGARPRLVALAGLCAMVFVAPGSGVRTQMFAYPCFAVVAREAFFGVPASSGRARVAALVLPLAATALWANLHGSFVLAPALFASRALVLALTERKLPRAGARFLTNGVEVLLVTAATWVNPRGPAIYAYLLHIGDAMGVSGTTDVMEWRPVSLDGTLGVGFLVLLAGGALLAIVRRERAVSAAPLVWFAFGLLALESQRFLAWWALTTIPAVAALTSPRSSEGPTTGSVESGGVPLVNTIAIGIFVGIGLGSFPGGPVFERLARDSHLPYAGARALGLETPLRTLEAFAARSDVGRVFHNQAVGGALEWMLCPTAPRPVAFVDQRFELTPPALWEEYFAISQARPGWKQHLDRRDIRTLLLHEAHDRALVAAIEQDGGWRFVQRELAYRSYVRAEASPR
jgi:hypothetical protein